MNNVAKDWKEKKREERKRGTGDQSYFRLGYIPIANPKRKEKKRGGKEEVGKGEGERKCLTTNNHLTSLELVR